jgi:hypothetical protein
MITTADDGMFLSGEEADDDYKKNQSFVRNRRVCVKEVTRFCSANHPEQH